MITRRNLLRNSGIAALAAASSNLLLSAARSLTTSTFDYYIAPNGDDNNPGTLASPWSITALNSKQSIYAGKRVGIIGDVSGARTSIRYGTMGGVQTTLYSLLQAQNSRGYESTAISVNGGSSGASTYLGSCTSSGVYQRGWAVIDAAQPGTGTLPAGAAGTIIGQSFYLVSSVTNPGYVTLDGLVVKNGNFANVLIGDVQGGVIHGVIIQNCEIGPAVCSTSSENPGGIFLGTTSGAQVLNCIIHDCATTSGFVPGMGGITTYKALGLIVTNCTIYNCGYAIQNKDTNQWGTYSYNWFDVGTMGSYTGRADASCIRSCMPGPGETLTVHHCIMPGGTGYFGFGEDGTTLTGAMDFHNNTFFTPSSVSAGLYAAFVNNATGAAVSFYNNIIYGHVYGSNQGNPYGCLSFSNSTGLSGTSVDHNYYGTGCTFGAGSAMNYAQWQAAGYDIHSTSGGSPFSGTPTSLASSSFAITGAAATAGRSGAACGALDGSGTVGCNFLGTPTLTPDAPVLIKVS